MDKIYNIDENIARLAKEMNSFDNYVENSATKSYMNYVEEFNTRVNKLLEKHAENVNNEVLELVNYYKDKYAKKLAFAMNKKNSIQARMPSIMISGAGNFNIKKKEKQMQAMSKFWEEHGNLFESDNYYYNKIYHILTNNIIKSDDKIAIEKLEKKIAELEESHAIMKEANIYYRKNKTLENFELMSKEEIEKITEFMQRNTYKDQVPPPFSSWTLSNSNAEINRLKSRLSCLKKMKERATQDDANKYLEIDGVKVEENAEDMRIRLKFDTIPSEKERELLKSNGFKWSPKNTAWQRMLSPNGICATRRVLKELSQI